MNFFINASMPKQKSGIEHAELARFRLFNAHHVESRIVIRDWDPQLHVHAKEAGIADRQLIGMFDYFQEALDVPSKKIVTSELDFGVMNTHVQHEERRDLVFTAREQLVARVNLNNNRTVQSVELFDGFNNLFRVDHYDSRGFVSLSQWYTPDNKIGTETWQTPAGKTVLETFNKDDAVGKRQKSGWRLIDRDGTVRQFDTIERLTKHFFDLLNETFWSETTPNIFVLDRSHLGDWGLLHLKRPAYTVFYLHNSHASDSQDPMNAILNNFYEFGMHAMNGYDAVVSATHRQTRDVEARFSPQTKLFTIPVGIIPDHQLAEPRIPVAKRQFGKMVVFARIAWEKRLDDLVRAIGIVHRAIPAVSLDLYGYADPSENFKARRAIEAVIKEDHLEEVVKFKGYTTDVAEVENHAMMYGLTSRMEGFNLGIMEAISHGLIGFTYDVNYGPNEIIEDGINGRIVANGDYKALAAAILDVLRDPELAQQYSTGAYDSAKRYSETNVWQAWQALLKDAQSQWPSKLQAMPALVHNQ